MNLRKSCEVYSWAIASEEKDRRVARCRAQLFATRFTLFGEGSPPVIPSPSLVILSEAEDLCIYAQGELREKSNCLPWI